MDTFELTYKPFGEEALLIEWPSRIDEEILFDILFFQKIIENNLSSKIEETLNTFHSLTVFFNPSTISFSALVKEIKTMRTLDRKTRWENSNLWEIPVCYDTDFGIDLEEMAKEKNLSCEEIIALHSENDYTVYFTGFLPGFLYLGGLSRTLFTPRKATPRAKIIKGAVAIGGSQTGIYPHDSPGGWNIIGNSPIPLFNLLENPPCRIKAGDTLKFKPTSRGEYDRLVALINAGAYQLNPQTA